MPDNTQVFNGTGDTMATDLITDGGVANNAKAQRMKPGFGTDGNYVDVSASNPLPVTVPGTVAIAGTVPVSAAAALPTTDGYTELTGTAAALNADAVVSTDVRAYKGASLQLSGTWVGTVKLQGSNDNTTFFDIPLTQVSSVNPAAVTSTTANGLWMTPVYTRYVRVRATSYSSGTVTATLELFSGPAAMSAVTVNATGVGVSVNTEFDAYSPTTDAAGLSSQSGLVAATAGYAYNGGTWDRIKTANGATATSGTGLLGAAALGWDATNTVYRRLLCDASGYLLIRPQAVATATLSNVAAVTSSTPLAASNTARRGLTVHNDTTGTNSLYLKLGATASTTSFTVKIGPGGYWELPTFGTAVYTGTVDGIWDTAAGNARVTEL